MLLKKDVKDIGHNLNEFEQVPDITEQTASKGQLTQLTGRVLEEFIR